MSTYTTSAAKYEAIEAAELDAYAAWAAGSAARLVLPAKADMLAHLHQDITNQVDWTIAPAFAYAGTSTRKRGELAKLPARPVADVAAWNLAYHEDEPIHF